MEDGKIINYTPEEWVNQTYTPDWNAYKNQVWENFIQHHKKYRDVDLEKLHPQLAQPKFAYESLIKSKDYRGLRLSGGAGLGKTYFIFAVIKDLIFNHNMTTSDFEYVSEEDLFSSLKSYFGFSDANQALEKIMRRLRDVKVLFYDDLGAATKTARGDWGQQVLMEIFNSRYKEEKTTFVNTNLTLEELTELIGSRIADRLQDMHSIVVKGVSLRAEWKKHKKGN